MELGEQREEKQNAKIWSYEIVYNKLVSNMYHLNILLILTSNVWV